MSREGVKWNLTVATIAVCLVPVLFQLVIFLCLFQSYKHFDSYVSFQRALRQTESLMASLTGAQENALISFTRYRMNVQPRELEDLQGNLKDISRCHDDIVTVVKPYPWLAERAQPFLDATNRFSEVMSKTAEQARQQDPAAITDQEVASVGDFARLLRDGMQVRAELTNAHVFDEAAVNPVVHLQSTTITILAGLSLLNLLVGGGTTFVFLRFMTRRLEVAKTNCELILSGSPPQDEPTNCADFVDLDQALVHAASILVAKKRRRLAVSEGAPEVVFAIDQNMRVQMISDACHSRWGYSPEFLMHKSIVEIVHPSDAQAAYDMLHTARGAGRADGDLKIRHRSGMFVESRWSMKWNESRSQAVIVSGDTTQDDMARNFLNQLAEQQKALIDALPAAFVTTDQDGIITSVSRQMHEFFPEHKDFAGMQLEDLLRSAVRAPLWKDLYAAIDKPVELVLRDGREVPLSLELRVHQFPTADKPLHLVAFEDVSDRYEVDRYRQEIVAMVNHELRTPLTSVSTLLEMLRTGAYGEVDDTGIDEARRGGSAASGLLRLITDLVDIERAKVRRMQLAPEDFSTDDLLKQLFTELEHLSKNAGVEFPALDQPSANVLVDSGRARQALRYVLEVLLQCAEPETQMRLMTRDSDASHFDIFIGIGAAKVSEAEFNSLADVFENRAVFDRIGAPYARMQIACAEALLRLMAGSLRPMNVQGSLGFVIRLQKARAAVTA
jgi:signal transduction histidine kinase